MGKFFALFLFLFVSLTGSGEVKRIALLKHPRPVIRYDTPPATSVIIAGDTAVHHHRKHKIFAALLAFPLGLLGLHRMYLGTSTAVPFLYIATLGGVFGVLPFVDFVLILLCKDVNTYAHNPAIFMWTRKK